MLPVMVTPVVKTVGDSCGCVASPGVTTSLRPIDKTIELTEVKMQAGTKIKPVANYPFNT